MLLGSERMILTQLEITEQDFQNYLQKQKKESNLQNKEAMFVKYLRETNTITKEKLEILLQKYNLESEKITLEFPKQKFLDFPTYLSQIKNLDISGICHILLPTLGYYGYANWQYQRLSIESFQLQSLPELFQMITTRKQLIESLGSAITDYVIAGKLLTDSYNPMKWENWHIQILAPRESCRKELVEYQNIYGEEPVEKIKAYIKEKV